MTVRRLLQAASLGEVAWVELGRPRSTGVVPLVHQERPVLALTLDRADLAVSLAAAEVVDLVVREPRNTAAGWHPSAWRCASRLVEDLDGTLFERLLTQELRRYPPSRRFADSPLLAREHWWYLPRLLVTLDPVEELDRPVVRSGPADLLVVTVDAGRPVTGGVRRAGERLTPTWGPEPAPGPGLLHDQDATFPDLEQWTRWVAEVRVAEGGEVLPEEPLPEPLAPPRMPGLAERWRAERRFAAACRRGLAAWDHRVR